MRRRLMIAALLALPGLAVAQPRPVTPPPPPPPPPAPPAPEPPPEEKPQPDPELAKIADAFFKALQAGQVAKAYQDVWKGTAMDRKPADVQTLVLQTTTALQLYGKIDGWETVSEVEVAPSLRTHTYMLRGDVGPLFFRFQFYKKAAGWTVYRIDFADQIGRLP